MSFITRRALSTLIPPKIASPTGIGAAQDAARMSRVVQFYEKLPRGKAPKVEPRGWITKYRAKHFGDKESATPIVQAILLLVVLGYSQHYYFHFRHHKNNAH